VFSSSPRRGGGGRGGRGKPIFSNSHLNYTNREVFGHEVCIESWRMGERGGGERFCIVQRLKPGGPTKGNTCRADAAATEEKGEEGGEKRRERMGWWSNLTPLNPSNRSAWSWWRGRKAFNVTARRGCQGAHTNPKEEKEKGAEAASIYRFEVKVLIHHVSLQPVTGKKERGGERGMGHALMDSIFVSRGLPTTSTWVITRFPLSRRRGKKEKGGGAPITSDSSYNLLGFL